MSIWGLWAGLKLSLRHGAPQSQAGSFSLLQASAVPGCRSEELCSSLTPEVLKDQVPHQSLQILCAPLY